VVTKGKSKNETLYAKDGGRKRYSGVALLKSVLKRGGKSEEQGGR